MFVNVLKIAGLCAFTLTGCAELAAKSESAANPGATSTGLGAFSHGLGADVDFVLLDNNEKSCAARQASNEPNLQIFIKLEGGVRYDWCDYDDTSRNYEFAQRDYYAVRQNGGGWDYGYSAAFNCNTMAGYILSQVGTSAFPIVCKASP